MKVTTTHEVLVNSDDPTRGTLDVHVYINGAWHQKLRILSGPIQDIQQFVAGEINENTIHRRWANGRPNPRRRP